MTSSKESSNIKLTFTAQAHHIFDFLPADVAKLAFDKRAIGPYVSNRILKGHELIMQLE